MIFAQLLRNAGAKTFFLRLTMTVHSSWCNLKEKTVKSKIYSVVATAIWSLSILMTCLLFLRLGIDPRESCTNLCGKYIACRLEIPKIMKATYKNVKENFKNLQLIWSSKLLVKRFLPIIKKEEKSVSANVSTSPKPLPTNTSKQI